MARRMRAETAIAVRGVRALQVAALQSRLARLPESVPGVYDFRGERDQLRERIAALEASEDVQVQTWELAPELLPVVGVRSRFDQSGPRVFRISGDEVVPDEYRKAASPRA
jgi:hypothetical protein